VGDNTTAIDAVLECDTERLSLLAEEQELMEKLNASSGTAAVPAADQQHQQQNGAAAAANGTAAAANGAAANGAAAGVADAGLAQSARLAEVGKRLLEIGVRLLARKQGLLRRAHMLVTQTGKHTCTPKHTDWHLTDRQLIKPAPRDCALQMPTEQRRGRRQSWQASPSPLRCRCAFFPLALRNLPPDTPLFPAPCRHVALRQPLLPATTFALAVTLPHLRWFA
jgi:hypothetical protein